jgi:hypothetical protein
MDMQSVANNLKQLLHEWNLTWIVLACVQAVFQQMVTVELRNSGNNSDSDSDDDNLSE